MNEAAAKQFEIEGNCKTLMDEWLASTKSQQVFCERKAINYNQFVYWRSKFLKAAGKSRSQLASVKLTDSSAKPGVKTRVIKLLLPNGITVYIPEHMPQSTIQAVLESALQSCEVCVMKLKYLYT